MLALNLLVLRSVSLGGSGVGGGAYRSLHGRLDVERCVMRENRPIKRKRLPRARHGTVAGHYDTLACLQR